MVAADANRGVQFVSCQNPQPCYTSLVLVFMYIWPVLRASHGPPPVANTKLDGTKAEKGAQKVEERASKAEEEAIAYSDNKRNKHTGFLRSDELGIGVSDNSTEGRKVAVDELLPASLSLLRWPSRAHMRGYVHN